MGFKLGLNPLDFFLRQNLVINTINLSSLSSHLQLVNRTNSCFIVLLNINHFIKTQVGSNVFAQGFKNTAKLRNGAEAYASVNHTLDHLSLSFLTAKVTVRVIIPHSDKGKC